MLICIDSNFLEDGTDPHPENRTGHIDHQKLKKNKIKYIKTLTHAQIQESTSSI